MSRADKAMRIALQVLTGLTVAALAGVAGAISFSHMAALAIEHGQTGWKSSAFPVSVDGLELVASLFLLAQHRAGRHVGMLPWAALLVGTGASLAANVAVGGHDWIGRALAGWPAISLLVSIKLLFSMFDHATDGGPAVHEDRPLVRDDQRTVPDGTAVRRTDPGTVPTVRTSSGTIPRPGTDGAGPSTITPKLVPGTSGAGAASEAVARDSARHDVRDVADLIPAARAAHDALTATGRRLSRDALADRMREDGHGVSNARASLLVKILKAEGAITPLGHTPSGPPGREAGDPPQVAA